MNINPRTITRAVLVSQVRDAVRGAEDTKEAETRIKARFFPDPLVCVQERDERHFGVLIQSGPGVDSFEILCER